MSRYIYAAQKPWSLAAFADFRKSLPGTWTLVTSPQDLKNPALLDDVRYIFFPHWSNIVPEALLQSHECVCFHMADVPYGRGGSPLQNLIALGHKDTMVTALRMERQLDAGPVYLKHPMSLAGSAADIFERATGIILKMIAEIVEREPIPEPQSGAPTVFKRRAPGQSVLPSTTDIEALYDHIRMLDAPGYPQAFLDVDSLRLIFDQAHLSGDELTARVRFTLNKKDAQ